VEKGGNSSTTRGRGTTTEEAQVPATAAANGPDPNSETCFGGFNALQYARLRECSMSSIVYGFDIYLAVLCTLATSIGRCFSVGPRLLAVNSYRSSTPIPALFTNAICFSPAITYYG
jgi:hypothetical protein